MSSIDRVLKAAPAALLLLGVSACASSPMRHAAAGPVPGAGTALTPLDQYAPIVEQAPERLAIGVHAGGAISPGQDTALAAYAAEWREAGADAVVTVSAPGGAGPDGQMQAQAAADRLVRYGLRPAAIRMASYAADAPGAPVTLSYERVVATGPDCARKWDNLVATKSNEVSKHFGCAGATNLAAMIADPRDLQRPRAITPADAGRRAYVLDRYRQGLPTASAKDEQAQGVISRTAR